MPRRKGHQQRASERLNIALARIHASAGLLEAGPVLKKQIEEAIEEAYAALNDIRDVAAQL